MLDKSEVVPGVSEEDCPEPELPDFLKPVYYAHSQLGVDQHGKPTLKEQREWFGLYGVTDPNEQRIWVALWQVVTAAKLTEAQRRIDGLGDDA